MKLSDYHHNCTDTISSWFTNHTEFDAWIEWRELWHLPNTILEDAETIIELGFDPDEIDGCTDELFQAWMDKYYKQESLSITGQPVCEVLEQVEAVLDALKSGDVWDVLTGLILSANLAHVNGFMLVEYYIGSGDIVSTVNSISQNGLEATFPDLDNFIANFKAYEPEYY